MFGCVPVEQSGLVCPVILSLPRSVTPLERHSSLPPPLPPLPCPQVQYSLLYRTPESNGVLEVSAGGGLAEGTRGAILFLHPAPIPLSVSFYHALILPCSYFCAVPTILHDHSLGLSGVWCHTGRLLATLPRPANR